MTDFEAKVKEEADAFAYEHGRREIPTKPGNKFSRPDPDLYWGLQQGYIAGAESREVVLEKLKSAARVAYNALKSEERRCGGLFGDLADGLKALTDAGVVLSDHAQKEEAKGTT